MDRIARDLLSMARTITSKMSYVDEVADWIAYEIGEVKVPVELKYEIYAPMRGIRDSLGVPEEPDYPGGIEDLYVDEPKRHLFKIPIETIFKHLKIPRSAYMGEMERLEANLKEVVRSYKEFGDVEFTMDTDFRPAYLNQAEGELKGMKIRGRNIEILIDNIDLLNPDEVAHEIFERERYG
jgi:hypothetical protein